MRALLIGFLTLVILAAALLAVSFYAYNQPLPYTQATVTLPLQGGARGALARLHEAGLTPPTSYIALPVLLTGANRKLKAGEYEFSPGMSPAEIIGKITRGEVVIHKITIPEGWNSFQLRDALNAEPLLTGFLPPEIPEGSVLPTTVHFTRGEARGVVLARMQQSLEKTLLDLWSERDADLPLHTAEEALVLASIVERETGVPSERAQIAGVFVNRLRLGMPLQTDPSVAYGILVARGGVPMEHALTLADLRADTPYNSYTRTGLPPTPICNPGKDALMAVMHPMATDALYFVATGQGGHNFSATLQEHTQNVQLYRKTQRPQVAKTASTASGKNKR